MTNINDLPPIPFKTNKQNKQNKNWNSKCYDEEVNVDPNNTRKTKGGTKKKEYDEALMYDSYTNNLCLMGGTKNKHIYYFSKVPKSEHMKQIYNNNNFSILNDYKEINENNDEIIIDVLSVMTCDKTDPKLKLQSEIWRLIFKRDAFVNLLMFLDKYYI